MRGLIIADTHFRKDIPRCRTDANWMETQRNVLLFIDSVSKKYKCPRYIVGDLFNSSREPNEVINMVLEVLDDSDAAIAGNHDLPYHSFSNVDRSSIGVILNTVKEIPDCREYDGAHFGETVEETENDILFIHKLTFPDEKSRPDFIDPEHAPTAQELLDLYPNKKWIFTGDNHQFFHYEQNNRHVINPGCLLIQRADEIGYTTGFYFVDTDTDTIERISTPKELNAAISTQYLEMQESRNERIEAFVDIVRKRGGVSLSFKDNLKTALTSIKNESVKNVIIEVMEEI